MNARRRRGLVAALLLFVVPALPACSPASAATSVSSSPTSIKSVIALVSDAVSFESIHDVSFGGNWPTRAGYIFVFEGIRLLFTDLTGTHAANPTYSFGTNSPNFNNMLASNAVQSAANLNTIIANSSGGNGKNAQSNQSIANVFFQSPELDGTVPTVHVTVASSVGTTCKGRIMLIGHLYPKIP